MLISPGRIGRIGQPAGSTGRVSRLQSLLESLYGEGQEGVFFVPKPQVMGQQVLFQDAAGTTPVTADGDPVGLMLDISQGLVRGSELVPNGDFSRGMDEWNNNTVGNGQCEAVDGGIYVSSTDVDNRGGFSQNITGIVENGRSYIATYEISEVSGGGVHFGWGADYGGSHRYGHSYVTGPGVYSFIIPSLGGGQQILWVRSHRDGGSGVISNISVRELPGHHAVQEVSGSRPIYRTDGQYHWLEFDGVDDYLVTPAIDFTHTDTMSVFAALRPFAAGRCVYEIGPNYNSTNPAFGMFTTSDRIELAGHNGTGYFGGRTSTIEIEDPQITSHVQNIAAQTREDANVHFRRNGEEDFSQIVGTWAGVSDPTLTYIKAPLYIGARAGSSLFSNNHLYGFAVRSALTDDPLLSQVEQYLASLAGVTL